MPPLNTPLLPTINELKYGYQCQIEILNVVNHNLTLMDQFLDEEQMF